MSKAVQTCRTNVYRASSLAALLAAASLAAACGGGEPDLVITADGDNPEYGSVAVSLTATKSFTVTNVGKKAATLTAVSTPDLGLTGPFTLVGGTCLTGASIAPDAACTLQILFAPLDPGTFRSTIAVKFKVGGDSDTAKEEISGTGFVDCTITPALVARRQDGVNAANVQMDLDRARGTRDGQALTREQGLSQGYAYGYNETYSSGYNDPAYGYPAGYRQGFAEGQSRGLNNVTACNSGYDAGYDDGSSDGFDDGSFDGYNDGYGDGKIVGRADGYDAGYDDGADSCLSGAAPGVPVIPGPVAAATDLNAACYNQGYSATYNTNTYSTAYEAAKAANVAYQGGFSSGRATGQAEGRAAGRAAGYATGRSRGDSEGFSDGYATRYAQCYHIEYDRVYGSAYNQGYYDFTYGLDAGFDDGYDDGFNETYDTGYYDGRDDYCYGSATAARAASAAASSSGAARASRFGRNQPWLAKSASGHEVSHSAPAASLLPILSDASRAEILAKVAKVRTETRAQLKAEGLARNLLKHPRVAKKPAGR